MRHPSNWSVKVTHCSVQLRLVLRTGIQHNSLQGNGTKRRSWGNSLLQQISRGICLFLSLTSSGATVILIWWGQKGSTTFSLCWSPSFIVQSASLALWWVFTFPILQYSTKNSLSADNKQFQPSGFQGSFDNLHPLPTFPCWDWHKTLTTAPPTNHTRKQFLRF